MADRDKRISAYVTEERKDELHRRANEEGVSVSVYLNRLINRQLQMEAEDEISAQTHAVEQLQRTIDEGQRSLRKIGEEVENKNRKAGAYGVAAFVLLQREYSDAVVEEAIEAGNRRLHDDDYEPGQSEESETDTETDGGKADDDDYDPFDPLADGGIEE